MPRYFLEIKYDGGNYHGWQIQKNAVSVQQVLQEALAILFKIPVLTLGCGRTDTGVHARQFFVQFDIPTMIADYNNIVHRLNGLLPHDIAIRRCFLVADKVNARFDALSRTYQYHFYFEKNPFLKNRACWLSGYPDVKKMMEASTLLLTQSDFSCFSKNRTQVKTNICKISNVNWLTVNDELIFCITADRFLRGMVRAIVGSLLLVGENKISLIDFENILAGKDRSKAGASMPACGLYLEEVRYPDILT